MRHLRPTRYPRVSITGVALVMLVLWGCASAPVPKPAPTEPSVTGQPPVDRPETSLLLPPSQYSALYVEAERFLEQFDWMAAGDVLGVIPPVELTQDDSSYLGYLQARIAYVRGQQEQALTMLIELQKPGINPAIGYRILSFRRHIVELSGEYLESARLGDQLLSLALPDSQSAIKRSIWRDLQRIPADVLQRATLEASAGTQWEAWLELALISRAGVAHTTRNLPTWIDDNPMHPAANPLPAGLGYLLEPAPPLQRIALLLPLTGRLAPAGKAIRDGYLASYYAARATGAVNHEILLLDLDGYASAGAAYDEAVRQGADLVVGPLSREAVTALGNHPNRPVPVLALNRAEEIAMPGPDRTALVQFSLAPEDEAKTIAELAFGQGARSALLIRPAGDWGSKVAQALLEQWSTLGGTIANSVTYASRDDYSASVKTALNIYDSEQRARGVREMLATSIEFTARRRRDVDVVFLLCRNGSEARSLKPLLAFHYAGSLPVYAISSIYSGIPDPRDRDLDGINLVETPWLLGASPGLRVAITAGDTGSDTYTRLNALGADAFLLQSRIRQLQAGADALLRGNTGLLSINARLQIKRELSLATFDEGVLTAQ